MHDRGYMAERRCESSKSRHVFALRDIAGSCLDMMTPRVELPCHLRQLVLVTACDKDCIVFGKHLGNSAADARSSSGHHMDSLLLAICHNGSFQLGLLLNLPHKEPTG